MLLVWLTATQIADLRRLENGLSRTGDAYTEADTLRSAEYYAKFGFITDAGLPHIVYGDRFPDMGSVRNLELPLTRGVYTRYPPLPNILCGLFEVTFGFDHLWAWRLVPVALTLAATAVLFFALQLPFGPMVAAGVTVLASAVPMTLSHMHDLHFQGYAHALLLAELGLLTHIVFGRRAASSWQIAQVALIAFVQGWLSFEYVFIVTGAAIPLALVAQQYGRPASVRLVLPLVVAAGAGFIAAGALHFLQVAIFHESAAAAIADMGGRAVFRIIGDGRTPYPKAVLVVGTRYLKALWIGPDRSYFGSLLPGFTAGLVLSAWLAGRNNVRLPAAVRSAGGWLSADVMGLIAAYGISGLWVIVMPEHANAHQHFVPRIFFLAYFTAVLACVLRASAWIDARVETRSLSSF